MFGLLRWGTRNLLKVPSHLNRRRVQSFSSVSSQDDGSHSSISADEFYTYFKACVPVKQRSKTIAVAFSGGPDSTCLLYLLKQLATKSEFGSTGFNNLVAVTIDHGLQSASSQMTAQCVELANSLQVKHLVLKIPWGIPPFSTLSPHSGLRAFENVAREARYHLLLAAMRAEGVTTLALGHHADDQLETALLRLSRGSGPVGAGGMRARRRWGMGFGSGPECVGWAGQHGMARWVVRPLLQFPKERLVATCRENELEYVEDSTNFQPDITDRNRIRHSLMGIDEGRGPCNLTAAYQTGVLANASETLLGMASRVDVLNKDSGRGLNVQQENNRSAAGLKAAVQVMSDYVDQLENEVSEELVGCIRPSPVSTILLSSEALARVTDNAVRLGMVRRILRCVSPFPWGSPHAEAGRRTASLQRIVDTLWGTTGNVLGKGTQGRPRGKLVAGAGVLWTPSTIDTSGRLRFSAVTGPGGEAAWLASRQPPIRRPVSGAEDFSEASGLGALELDITPTILSAFQRNPDDFVEILYDCRFLLHICPRLLPPYVLTALSQESGHPEGCQAKVIVVPHSTYFLPKIVLRRTNADTHTRDVCKPQDSELVRLLPDGSTHFLMHENNNGESLPPPAHDQRAVRITWIRTLDS
ncbi:hypothetical protein M0805_006503 [Coniferiporia weirii]|nr:hypothetical protein M0805_006503 [Coniferiporia weirii]